MTQDLSFLSLNSEQQNECELGLDFNFFACLLVGLLGRTVLGIELRAASILGTPFLAIELEVLPLLHSNSLLKVSKFPVQNICCGFPGMTAWEG